MLRFQRFASLFVLGWVFLPLLLSAQVPAPFEGEVVYDFTMETDPPTPEMAYAGTIRMTVFVKGNRAAMKMEMPNLEAAARENPNLKKVAKSVRQIKVVIMADALELLTATVDPSKKQVEKVHAPLNADRLMLDSLSRVPGYTMQLDSSGETKLLQGYKSRLFVMKQHIPGAFPGLERVKATDIETRVWTSDAFDLGKIGSMIARQSISSGLAQGATGLLMNMDITLKFQYDNPSSRRNREQPKAMMMHLVAARVTPKKVKDSVFSIPENYHTLHKYRTGLEVSPMPGMPSN